MDLVALKRALSEFVAYRQVGVGRTPGTGNAAWLADDLPPRSPIGAGAPVQFKWRLTQPPQVLHLQAVPTQGLGGILHGQVVTQSLTDPSSSGLN